MVQLDGPHVICCLALMTWTCAIRGLVRGPMEDLQDHGLQAPISIIFIESLFGPTLGVTSLIQLPVLQPLYARNACHERQLPSSCGACAELGRLLQDASSSWPFFNNLQHRAKGVHTSMRITDIPGQACRPVCVWRYAVGKWDNHSAMNKHALVSQHMLLPIPRA